MVNYQGGKIYQIVNDVNDKIYIGSTVTSLSNRMHKHRESAKAHKNKTSGQTLYDDMQEFGEGKFRILLVEYAPCDTKRELEAREYEVMSRFDKSKLYNIRTAKKLAEEHKKKLSDSGKEASKKRVARQIEANKPLTAEQRQQMLDEFSRFYAELKVGNEVNKVIQKEVDTSDVKQRLPPIARTPAPPSLLRQETGAQLCEESVQSS